MNVMNPTGGAISRPVINSSVFPLYSLKDVLSTENIRSAWKQVRGNRGAPGIDDLSVDVFPTQVRPKWMEIKRQILAGEYFPQLDGFNQGYSFAADIDLEQFFDTVSHRVLMSRVCRHIQDKGLLQLIRRFLRSGIKVKGRLNQTRRGVPQGGPLSPLLSNILLDDLDKELEKRGHKFARYADDVMILVKSKRAGERVMRSITRFLEKTLKVKVNQDKSKVARLEERSFLGFQFRRKKFWASEKSVQKFKQKVRELSSRSWGVSMEYRFISLKQYIQGWMAYYAIGLKYDDAVELDHWLRRRIRMCYWKQWKRPRTRIRELLKRGAPKHQAILTGLSRKGYWRLSKTSAMNAGLGNQYLEKQGLVSIKDLWIKSHYPTTVR